MANVNLFRYHLKGLKSHSNVLLVSAGNNKKQLRNIVNKLKSTFKFEVQMFPSDNSPIEIEGEYDLIVISDFEKNAARKTQFRIDKRKQIGTPIVFGFARPLFFSDPPWSKASLGLSYPGMFKLAGTYLKSLKTKGDYMEFGVYDGRTVTLAYHTMKTVANKFYAFDSYEGLIGTLNDEQTNFKDGQYFSSEATFNHNMKVARVPSSRVKAVKGDFLTELTPDLLKENDITKCICAHIDCDIYAPAKAALDFITDIIVDGAMLLFDDYDQFGGNPKKGERRALQEWVDENPNITVSEYRCYSVFCRSFIVHKS